MLNKKYIFLILILVSISIISSASATENITDVMANDTGVNDAITTIDDTTGDTLAENQNNENSKIKIDNQNEILTLTEPSAYDYTIQFNDIYEISGSQGGEIKYYMNPCQDDDYYAYDFYFKIFGSYTKSGDTYTFYDKVYESDELYSSYDRDIGYYTYSFDPGELPSGLYYLVAINYDDEMLMDIAPINITEKIIIQVDNNYDAFYNSGTTMTAIITDKTTHLPLNDVTIKVTFTGTSTLTKYYSSDENGKVSFIPPVGVGSYYVTFSPGESVQGDSVIKTAVIKKSNVDVTAYKITTYQGYKLKLKAIVKSQGRYVNEGYVKFTIAGKSYTVPVKNGVATKIIKLNKIRKYKYSATFTGNNFYSKTVKSQATVKKRYDTKISARKSIKGYWKHNKKVIFRVKTKGGKNVKSGYLYIHDKTYGYYYKVKVSHGKAKFTFTYYGNYITDYYNDYYYHKKAVTKYKISYKPTDKQYKGSHVKFKKISIYKCPVCGKKKKHTHGSGMYKARFFVRR